MNALAFVLDIVRTNTKTILQETVSQSKMSNFDFTYMLGKMLVLPYIERRYASSNGLPLQLVNKMQRVLKVVESRCIEKALDNSKEGQSHVCKGKIVGKPEYIALLDKLNHRLKKGFLKCLHFVCKGISEVLCSSCKEAEVESGSSTESWIIICEEFTILCY